MNHPDSFKNERLVGVETRLVFMGSAVYTSLPYTLQGYKNEKRNCELLLGR